MHRGIASFARTRKDLVVSDLGARYAVCERVLRLGSFDDDVAAAADLGVAAIAVDAQVLDDVDPEEARRILDGAGMAVSSYIGLGSVLAVGGGVTSVDEVTRRLDIAATVGAPNALVTTGPLGGRNPLEADDECREWLGKAGLRAAARNMRVMLEPVHPILRRWSYVHQLTHALELVDGVEGTGVLIDFGHLFWERGLAETIRMNVDAIASVQVTSLDEDALESGQFLRAPVSGGAVRVADLVDVLEDAGYRGWYEDETNLRLARTDRINMLREARTWFAALDERTR